MKTSSLMSMMIGVIMASPAGAQGVSAQTSPAGAAESGQASDIVVTGSRVIKDGYKAPTPVSVLSAEALTAIAPVTVADAVNRMPALLSSPTPRAQVSNLSSGTIGVNQLNLRSLGVGRTLVLLDGKRVINSSGNTTFSAPDVNNVPTALLSRVDVVTGGASAAYGSDALSGVVNFVVDHDFKGIKGSVQGGVSTYGDGKNYLASLAAGQSFADDRGHILLSGEYAHNDGIRGYKRPWNENSALVVQNPAYTATNGQPFLVLSRNVGLNNATPGGLITAGPLRGTVFGPGGEASTFNFGTVTTNNIMIGGDWQYSRIDDLLDLDPKLNRISTYGRLSYDVLDDVELYAEGQYARTRAGSHGAPNRRLGNLTIRADNAFIPAAVAARLAALNQASFTMGTTNADIGVPVVDNKRSLSRWTVGTTGKLDVIGSNWTWNAYYQQSRSRIFSRIDNAAITANYLLAIDAIRNPATGTIVCRSTLTSPANGCVPYNAMGTGVNDARAISYVTGTSQRRDKLGQDVAALDVAGEPFSTWAGPVSVALGVEHRRETLSGVATPLDEANGFFVGNFKATNGKYDVTEGFLETNVPLAADEAWAKSLDLNGAVRLTDYSTSGSVTTWKVGVTYSPISDIRFRATRSRDIRAANLGELFSGGQTASGASINDPFTNTNLSSALQLSRGNPVLKPEKADSFGIGAVMSPRFIPGLQASVDYYSIKIKGAIATPGMQQVINLCFQGNQTYCSYITRVNNVITLVTTSPQNVAKQSTRGLDFDLSYSLPLSTFSEGVAGSLSFRGMATYVISIKQSDLNGIVEGAGVIGSFTSLGIRALSSPKFKSTLAATYRDDAFDVTGTWRHIAGGKYSTLLTECAASCPIGNQQTISNNRIQSNELFDLAITYRPFEGNRGIELFGTVDNIFNTAPPLIYGTTSDGSYQGQSNFFFDRVGRVFRAGARFKM